MSVDAGTKLRKLLLPSLVEITRMCLAQPRPPRGTRGGGGAIWSEEDPRCGGPEMATGLWTDASAPLEMGIAVRRSMRRSMAG